MDTLPLTVDTVPADIGVALSAALAAANPVGPMSGRGRALVRLCNTSGNARLYLAVQADAPDGTVPGIPVRVGDWYPLDLQITPAGGIWAWASRDGAKIMAQVVRWS